jgi:hypothetical protein
MPNFLIICTARPSPLIPAPIIKTSVSNDILDLSIESLLPQKGSIPTNSKTTKTLHDMPISILIQLRYTMSRSLRNVRLRKWVDPRTIRDHSTPRCAFSTLVVKWLDRFGESVPKAAGTSTNHDVWDGRLSSVGNPTVACTRV